MSHRIRKVPKTKPKRERREKWEDVRKELYKSFAEAGIVSCEIQGPNCTGSNFLSFAHSLRRRKIARLDGKEHAEAMRCVIRCCINDHVVLDSHPHDVTEDIVKRIIKKRVKQVKCTI